MIEKSIFEILIYRIKEDKFNSKYEKDKNSFLKKHTTPQNSKRFIDLLENRFWGKYGGPWKYNQIVGAINIYILGDQIRGEIWQSTKERFRRKMNNKNIEFSGNVFEITVDDAISNVEIFKEIKRSIRLYLKSKSRLNPDFTAFDNIGKYINWKGLSEYDERQ